MVNNKKYLEPYVKFGKNAAFIVGDKKSSPKAIYSPIDTSESDNSKESDQKKYAPWGSSDDFPIKLQELLKNNFAPGLLDFKAEMIYGLGPKIFFSDDLKREKYLSEIQQWLESWHYEYFIQKQIADFVTYANIFAGVMPDKGGKIAYLEHFNAKNCRLWLDKNNIYQGVLYGNFEKKSKTEALKAWDFNSTDKKAAFHNKKASAGRDYYALPVYVGVLDSWVPIANEIPKVHLAMLQNSISAVFQVTIPIEIIEKIKSEKNLDNQGIKKYVDDILDKFDETLTGTEQAGKYFNSFSYESAKGERISIEIKKIERSTKQDSESYLGLYNDANQAFTSAFQVPPALACIQLGNSMSSGSDVLNQFNYYKVRLPMSRDVILYALNRALKINYPESGAKIAFQDLTLVHQALDKSGIKQD